MSTTVKELSDSDLADLFGLTKANEVELGRDGRLVHSQPPQLAAPTTPSSAADLRGISEILRGSRWD